MTEAFDLRLLFALAIVVLSLVAFGYLIWSKISALGLLRDDFDRRAPWLALGVILGGAVVYYVKH